MKLRGWIGRNTDPKVKPGGFSRPFPEKYQRTYSERVAHELKTRRDAIKAHKSPDCKAKLCLT